MAALLTIIAVAAGTMLGLAKGGRLENAITWRPAAWELAVGGVAVQLLLRLTGWSGGLAVFVDIVSTIAVLAFAVLNIRLGGMVVIVIGLSLNLLPAVMNWGTPVRPQALVSAGIVTQKDLDKGVTVDGPRHLADGDTLGFLGETIPLPTGQVISLGDLVLHAGYVLVIASVLRRRRVRASRPPTYRQAIEPLGDGPAPRRGPAQHPPRLDDNKRRPRQNSGGRTRRVPTR